MVKHPSAKWATEARDRDTLERALLEVRKALLDGTYIGPSNPRWLVCAALCPRGQSAARAPLWLMVSDRRGSALDALQSTATVQGLAETLVEEALAAVGVYPERFTGVDIDSITAYYQEIAAWLDNVAPQLAAHLTAGLLTLPLRAL